MNSLRDHRSCFAGGGKDLCPGRRFARTEIKTIIVALVRRMEVTIDATSCVGGPLLDGSRAGLGTFPPLKSVRAVLKVRDL